MDNLRARITPDVPYHTSRLLKTRMIYSLAEFGLRCLTIFLAVGLEIVSLRKRRTCELLDPVSFAFSGLAPQYNVQ